MNSEAELKLLECLMRPMSCDRCWLSADPYCNVVGCELLALLLPEEPWLPAAITGLMLNHDTRAYGLDTITSFGLF